MRFIIITLTTAGVFSYASLFILTFVCFCNPLEHEPEMFIIRMFAVIGFFFGVAAWSIHDDTPDNQQNEGDSK